MLAHVASRAKPLTSVSTPRQGSKTARLVSRNEPKALNGRNTQIRDSAPRSAATRRNRRIAYRSYFTSSSSAAKSQQIVEEVPEIAHDGQADESLQTVADLPLHCVFKVLAVETPPNYFVPVRRAIIHSFGGKKWVTNISATYALEFCPS